MAQFNTQINALRILQSNGKMMEREKSWNAKSPENKLEWKCSKKIDAKFEQTNEKNRRNRQKWHNMVTKQNIQFENVFFSTHSNVRQLLIHLAMLQRKCAAWWKCSREEKKNEMRQNVYLLAQMKINDSRFGCYEYHFVGRLCSFI